MIVIVSGLKPGERVAADGAFKLREGVLVNTVVRESLADMPRKKLGGL